MVTLHLTILTLPKGVAHRATHRKHERGNKPQRGMQTQRRGRNSHLPEQGNKKPHAIHTDKAKKNRKNRTRCKQKHTHTQTQKTDTTTRSANDKEKQNKRTNAHTHKLTHQHPPLPPRPQANRGSTSPNTADTGRRGRRERWRQDTAQRRRHAGHGTNHTCGGRGQGQLTALGSALGR